MYKQEVIGFDAREMWLDTDEQWKLDRKDKLLLRHDILKPLSVDSYIWYSVFSEVTQPRLWLSIPRAAKYSGNQWDNIFSEDRKLSNEPDGYRPRRVWRNLASLENYLNQKWGNNWNPCDIIAVVEILTDETYDEEAVIPEEKIIPEAVDPNWKFLGYDVADYELYTGLFEGELNPADASMLREEWKDHLNENHLFTEPQKAFEYISVANQRYPSHMPYWVYGLYLVHQI